MSHLIGGTVILVDWCLEKSWFFFFNGWPLLCFSLYYSIFLTLWKIYKGIAIYPTIDPTSMSGMIIVMLLNLVGMPVMLGTMTILKSYTTVMLLRHSNYAARNIEFDLPISYDTSN